MIEFKAECGHTIRAKDEDEGKVVRCSYCGQETQVPQNSSDDLDSLFGDLEDPTSPVATAPKSKRRRKVPGKISTGKADGGFDPLAVALKMVYAAVVIVVLIVATKLAWSYLDTQKPLQPDGGQPQQPPPEEIQAAGPADPSKSGPKGLLTARSINLDPRREGIYVNCVPSDARVWWRPASASTEDIFQDSLTKRCEADKPIDVTSGDYEVAIGIRINHPALMEYPNYFPLRRQIEDASQNSAVQDAVSRGQVGHIKGITSEVDKFFLPDGCDGIEAVLSPTEGLFLVRTRKTVRVLATQWTAVHAAFLPDLPLAQLMSYLPRRQTFGFNDQDIHRELSFYGVKETDQKFVVDALRRTGAFMYRQTDAKEFLYFVIHLFEGTVKVDRIRASDKGR